MPSISIERELLAAATEHTGTVVVYWSTLQQAQGSKTKQDLDPNAIKAKYISSIEEILQGGYDVKGTLGRAGSDEVASEQSAQQILTMAIFMAFHNYATTMPWDDKEAFKGVPIVLTEVSDAIYGIMNKVEIPV